MLPVAQGSNYIQASSAFAVFYPLNFLAAQCSPHLALFMLVYPTLINVMALFNRDFFKFF